MPFQFHLLHILLFFSVKKDSNNMSRPLTNVLETSFMKAESFCMKVESFWFFVSQVQLKLQPGQCSPQEIPRHSSNCQIQKTRQAFESLEKLSEACEMKVSHFCCTVSCSSDIHVLEFSHGCFCSTHSVKVSTI